jgi:hypothetical protein
VLGRAPAALTDTVTPLTITIISITIIIRIIIISISSMLIRREDRFSDLGVAVRQAGAPKITPKISTNPKVRTVI